MGASSVRAIHPEFDPLLAYEPLPLRAEFYPYGFPVSVASNSAAMIAAAGANWGGMGKIHDEPPLDLRCVVMSGGKHCPPDPVFRAQKNLLVAVAGRANFWCADLDTGIASAWVSSAAMEHPDYVRYSFLEGMAGCLLNALRAVFLHAACVSLAGRGVLLVGESGAGKSSLAYACARRGWTYCSDDASVLVNRAKDPLVMGNPRVFRFRANTGALFPEFRGMKQSRRAQGKPTIEVSTESLPSIDTARMSHVQYVVFLNRQASPAHAERISPADGYARFLSQGSPWPRELALHEARESAFRRLLRTNLLELRYRDLDSAVDLLERLIACRGSDECRQDFDPVSDTRA